MDHEKVLVPSVYLQTQTVDDGAIVWHSLHGNPTFLATGALGLLDQNNTPLVMRGLPADAKKAAVALKDLRFLTNPWADERKSYDQSVEKSRINDIRGGKMVKNLSLVVTSSCNFSCTYCIHFASLGHQDEPILECSKMTKEVAEKALGGYYAILAQNGSDKAVVNFGGGEPLIGFDIIQHAVLWIQKEIGPEVMTQFTINTNASLVTDKIAEFLAKHHFSVATSLDGLPAASDKARITRAGQPASALVLAGIEKLRSAGVVIDGVAATMTADNFPDIDETFIDWAISQKMNDLRIDLDVVGLVNIPTTAIVAKLTALRAYGVSKGIEVYGFWTRPVENLNEDPSLEPISFCGASLGSSICIGPSGLLTPCGYSSTSFGQVDELQRVFTNEGPYTQYTEKRLPGQLAICKGCEIEAFCAGGCNITRECDDAIMSKTSRMCELYIAMTRYLLTEQYAGQTDPAGGE